MVAENYKIILASNSPRRKELLAGIDVDFEVRVIQDIDESYPANLSTKILQNISLARKRLSIRQGWLTMN